MITTKYIWMNGKLVPWDDAKVHVLTHTLHYGAGAFEGIRCYETKEGPAIFRLSEHMERLIYSAKAVGMEIPFTLQQMNDAVVETVKANELKACYIRPLVYYGYGVMGLNPRNSPVDLMIACWPWGRYLDHDMVDLKVSKYIRIHPESTIPDAKIVGHYVNSILSVLELKGTKYHEALLLDHKGNIAEGPGENLFIVKNNKIYTPQKGNILAGITRASIIEIAKFLNFEVEEKVISLDEVLSSDEAFYTGTAAEVTPIKSIDDKVIANGTIGKVTNTFKDFYKATVMGENSSFAKYLTVVK